MADHPTLQETDLHHQMSSSDTATNIGTSALIFPKSIMAMSSTEQVTLPKQFASIPNLENSDTVTAFTMDDIVSSVSGSTSIASMSHLSDGTDGLAGLTLVSSNGNEFVMVSSATDLSGAGVIQQSGPTITLSLDEATRYLLQQQPGIARAVELSDGTFQILKPQIVQVEREDGTLETQTLHIEVLQALHGELAQQLPGINTGYTIKEDMSCLDETSSSSGIKAEAISSMNADDSHSEDSVDHIDFSDSANCQLVAGSKDSLEEYDTTSGSESFKDKRQSTKEGKKVTIKKEFEYKQPDLNCPIPLSEQTVVTIKGKKCVLAINQDTQQVCAYPIKPPPGTKRRGRPRMSEEEKAAAAERKRQQQLSHLATSPTTHMSPSEKSTAAETLLELSNVGSDGVRRSARKRKKAKVFEEYELEDSEADEDLGFEDNQEKDPDISLSLPEVKKKKILPVMKDTGISSSTVFVATPAQTVKRGRGRPRRYPPPGQSQTTSIPAIMIPSANGQTLVMTQGLQNLPNFHRQLPNIIPKPSPESSALTIGVPSSVVSDRADANTLSLTSDTDTLPLDTSGVLDSNSIIPPALQGDTIPIVGDNTDSSDHGDTMDQTSTNLLSFMTPATSASEKSNNAPSTEGLDAPIQPTMIQIPDNILASLGFKKDPVKIGLKASERELEKLKCPKCDFQGYYVQQYRSHIATHGEDIQKCKCCSYLSLDGDELLQHFKEYHPRCICCECDYMAEHAYIIKRHMMRHDTKSCTCNLCGKVYKDMYILKMHIKMVHMPAEVLFECIVCSKKFTRKAHLKRHLRIHEPEKPFKCPVCDYRGCERSDISKHMLIHEEPKHTCERCGKTFRHVKNKELHVKRHYGQRDYKCGVCDFFGYTFTDIRKHIERKHQDIKTLICDKCNKHFRNELALKEHQQTCNVMMIEQVLAIPTSTGGTSQATIQIPTNLGPDGHLILDGQAITVEESQMGLAEGTTEEEEEDMDDEEGGINETMQIIMTESGEQLRIISREVLDDSGQIVSHAVHQGNHILDQEGHDIHDVNILSDSDQILDHIGQIVSRKKQVLIMSGTSADQVEGISQHFVDQTDSSCQDLVAVKEASDDHDELAIKDNNEVSNNDHQFEVKSDVS